MNFSFCSYAILRKIFCFTGCGWESKLASVICRSFCISVGRIGGKYYALTFGSSEVKVAEL